MTEIAIAHHAKQQQFVIEIEGEQAVLEYHLQDDQIDFSRTYVPETLRGKGLAERLVAHGLRWAKEQQYQITASCWYVQKFI
ncbi:GNAT family N-acetyltransferase [Shewanella psychrotolerans]|uniref:GNAT family N-acetyltransferase n=1 Tax=Shewanella psychrotolerans TaxID=2864206 RepID=UPI001C656ECE|nr:GNAT family N-acetyltransferase [Shewanella psychrotolerans]QYK01360.1 N-acetyltransferase [Shewanella psychrotolerans]